MRRLPALMAQAQMMLGQVSEQIMHGMQLSVMCSEDGPRLRPDPADAATVLGSEFLDFTLAQCAVWPKGAVPENFHAPLRSEVPVLLLSGEFDPVTPPRYGEQVLAGLARGINVMRGGGPAWVGWSAEAMGPLLEDLLVRWWQAAQTTEEYRRVRWQLVASMAVAGCCWGVVPLLFMHKQPLSPVPRTTTRSSKGWVTCIPRSFS